MIVVIDYHVGNLGSVLTALKRLDIDAVVSSDPEIIRQAKGIILPGVGSFPVAMENLHNSKLIPVLTEMKDKGVPILGICLGMQLLFELGKEFKDTKGLGYLRGTVEYMNIDEKVPHMGWNQLLFERDHPLLKYIKEKDYVYFVHSYYANIPSDELIAYADYGGLKVTAIAGKDNVMGCQFHPEKSGIVGKNILRAFKEIVYDSHTSD